MQAIQDFPAPSSLCKLHEFLGLVNFYRRFDPHCASLVQPLTDLLSPKRTSTDSFHLSESALSAFQAVKTALAKATLLTHPDPSAPYCLMVDASNVTVGGVLQQCINHTWQPISFFFKRLQPAETKYSTFSCKLLSIYLSISHFHHFLEGREFYVLTDHKPLIHALSSSSSHYSPRETCLLDVISQFTSDIRHVHGKDNPVADALSRMDINALNAPLDPTPPLNYTLITQAQQNDSDLSQLKSTPLHIQALSLSFSTGTILCDTTTASPPPYIPTPFRSRVFDQFHNRSHP